MPAAVTKPDLIARTTQDFAKLSDVLDRFPRALRLVADEDGVTPKDLVGHRAHWIQLFLGWYTDGQAGKPVDFPAPGYKWNQLKAYNADLRQAQAGLDWDAARALLDANHARLMSLLEGLDQAALYGGPMKGARNDWTTGRWAEAAGASHYRSAAKYLRGRTRAPRN
ncbi:hypothetical protein SAMN05444007_108131 [Cribrihabitans marinus]|uniref:DfsB family protein n=1 Tax=Cribrihabitans marinus TaxID=1227549 RepID=A0A1H7CR29_9RHOB|nr:ClbS/DfsB family four-helix bundle protein [Cribrihabitans marinus]GGH35580.1 hypothetical protein GCM10010973_29010 [Cribrihabitans marinus]SEJ89190.1 hypothetical protein SAMN05444007_108131 [Cribrihabitans marinus]